jgi:hypothetical protein
MYGKVSIRPPTLFLFSKPKPRKGTQESRPETPENYAACQPPPSFLRQKNDKDSNREPTNERKKSQQCKKKTSLLFALNAGKQFRKR